MKIGNNSSLYDNFLYYTLTHYLFSDFFLITIHGLQKQKPKDEMRKSPKPYIGGLQPFLRNSIDKDPGGHVG